MNTKHLALCFVLLVLGAEAALLSSRKQMTDEAHRTATIAAVATHMVSMLDVGDDTLQMDTTWVDQAVTTVFGAQDNGYYVLSMTVMYGLLGVAIISVAILVISVVCSFITTPVDTSNGHLSPLMVFVYRTSWMGVGLFIVISSLQAIVTTKLLQVVSMTSSSSSLALGLPQLTQVMSRLVSSTASSVDADSPQSTVFCSQLWSANTTANLYPPGSAVYAYNMERLGRVNASSSEGMKLRSLLLNHDVSEVFTQDAKSFGIISNACEQFHGNLNLCCDESLCRGDSDPTTCFSNRCPGKALSLTNVAVSSHCVCLDAMAQIGYPTTRQQAFDCVAEGISQVVANVKSFVGISGVQSSAAPLCLGVFDGAVATLSGSLKRQLYAFGNYPDFRQFGSQSMYIRPNSASGGSSSLTFSLQQCSNSTLAFAVRSLNPTTSPISVSVVFDGSAEQTIVFPAGGDTSTWNSGVTFTVSQILSGTHTLALQALNNVPLPWIHQLQVCSPTC